MSIYRSSLRKTAGRLLLLWALVLVAGVAHACSLASWSGPADRGEAAFATVIRAHAIDCVAIESAGEACSNSCDSADAASTPTGNAGEPPAPDIARSWYVLPTDLRLLEAAPPLSRAHERCERPPLPLAIAYLRFAL